MSLINYEYITELFNEGCVFYNTQAPFPHIVIDNFLHRDTALELAKEFPKPTERTWWKYDNVFEKKLAFDNLGLMPSKIKQLLTEFNSAEFIKHLEKLTNIQGLYPDPAYRGGGMHMTLPGGKLDIHADFNIHPELKLERRLNVIYYLNPVWELGWSGNLELWNRDMTHPVKTIIPSLNKFVCFNVTDDSNHGHPDPLTCPEGYSRQSLAVYYYTKPEKKLVPHSTIYKKRPQDSEEFEIERLRIERSKGRI